MPILCPRHTLGPVHSRLISPALGRAPSKVFSKMARIPSCDTSRTTISMGIDRCVSSVCHVVLGWLTGSMIQDAFDLFTGSWIPRRGPAASLGLVTDSRPLVTRSVRSFPRCGAAWLLTLLLDGYRCHILFSSLSSWSLQGSLSLGRRVRFILYPTVRSLMDL